MRISPTALPALPPCQVVPYNMGGVNAHPFHVHINSFQIAATPADTADNYFLAEDWHDVVLIPNPNVNVRFQTNRYIGKQVWRRSRHLSRAS